MYIIYHSEDEKTRVEVESSPSSINFNAVEGPRTAEEDDEILSVGGVFRSPAWAKLRDATRKSKRNRVWSVFSKNRYK